MIRDPSDGSVREVVDEKPQSLSAKARSQSEIKDILSSTTSGLRQPTRTDAQQRLEASRAWLKDYNERKAASHADGGSDGEELQAAGRSVEDVRKAES